MAFLWVHPRLGGWRESAGALDYCATYIHSAPEAQSRRQILFPESDLRQNVLCTRVQLRPRGAKGWYLESSSLLPGHLRNFGNLLCRLTRCAHRLRRCREPKTGIQLKSCCHHRGRPPRSRAREGKLASGRGVKGLAEDQPGHYRNSEIAPRPGDRICERVEAASER